jgi:DNA-binding MarR family transcriptional regulator
MKREEAIQSLIENFITLRKSAIIVDAKANLSRAQIGLLVMLAHHPTATVNEVSNYLGIGKSAVSQLVDSLAVKNLVSRANDPNDRRIVRLSLTATGQRALADYKKHAFDGLTNSLNELSDSEINQLAKLHEKVIKNIKRS